MTGSPNPTAPAQSATTDDAARKAHATLDAQAALAGHHCFKTDDGTILLSRWGCTAQFETVAKAADWLSRVTGRSS